MWTMRRAGLLHRLSIRKTLLLFITAVCAVSFAYIPFATHSVYAATDTTWNGDSLVYNQQSYVLQPDAGVNDSRGFQTGTHVYSYTEPSQSSISTAPQLIHFIYFSPNTDPTTATSASYETFDFTPPDIFTHPTGQKTISTAPKTTADTKTTSCALQGVGWIVCPITDFFAGAMDWLFSVLSGFLAVRPVSTDQTSALFRTWSYMRNFANVAFVIAFLVVIYSQVTSMGISNYGIKKILPRLVVAAILVNISYWICAIAVDISNILGYSVQDIFISLRNNLIGSGGNTWNVSSWRSITGFVLSGGTALTVAGIAGYSALAGAGGAIYLLLPILVGVLMAVLVALLVMAARQAIITILIIISPLAFVAYILPNTEKYFRQWHELGITMLVMFPAFSVVFGGSQFAGTAIIQNADSINLIILGMAVQIAPLAITPLLLRFSGSFLSRVAGVVNNPKRGLVDRTRNWSQGRADQHKARALGNPATRKRDFLARTAQAIDNRNRDREGWKKVNEANSENRWRESRGFQAIDTATRESERAKKILEQESTTAWNVRANVDTKSLEQELKLRVTADQVSLSQERLDVMHREFKVGHAPVYGPQTQSMAQLMNEAEDTTRSLALTGMRKQAAERKHTEDLTQELLENTHHIDGQSLRDYAGGVLGDAGAESVLSSTVAADRDAYRKRIKEKTELIHHFNVSSNGRQDVAMGKDVTVSKNGVTYTFRGDDDYAREAAIDEQLLKGSFGEVQAIIKASGAPVLNAATGQMEGGETFKYRTSISSFIKDYKLDKKAVFFGAQTIDDVAQGRISGEAGLDMVAARALVTGKISDEDTSGMKKDALRRLFEVTINDVRRSEDYQNANAQKRSDMESSFNTHQQEFRHSAWRVMNTPVLSRNAELEAKEVLERFMQQPPTP